MEAQKLISPITMMRIRAQRENKKKRTSLMKLGLSTENSLRLVNILITPTTILETKKAPPRTLFRPTSPSSDRVKETILEKTSDAPLPRARRVTPAIVGGSFRILDRLSSDEQK